MATSLSTLTCQGAVATPSVVGNLRDSIGLDEGIVLMGSGDPIASLPDPRPQLEATAFSWNAGGFGCPSPELVEQARKQPLFNLLLANGSITVANTLRGSRRLFINAVRTLDDVPGLYVESTTGAPDQYIIYVHCSYPPPEFPFVVAIYTNVGVKPARLDAPPTLQNADVSQMVARAIRDSLPVCEKLINPWGGPFLNPEWLVDPSPELGSESYEQIWELDVPASSLGGTLTVNAGNHQSEVRIIAAAGREFSASFVTGRGDRLKLHFHEAAGKLPTWHAAGSANNSAARLGLTQTLLSKASSLGLGRTLESIPMVAGGSYPILGAGWRSGLALYDLSAPSDPRKAFELALDGLHGIAEGRLGQVLGWGDFGLVAIDRRDSDFVVRPVLDTPVQTVARLGARWFASTVEGIVVLDCDLQRERCIRRPGGYCGSLCRVERQLLWIVRSEAFRLSSCGGSWIPVASDTDCLPYAFETLRMGRHDHLFAARDQQGGSLWTLKSGGRLSIEYELDDDPWFRRSARLSDVWAIADRAGVITVYGVAGSASFGVSGTGR